MLIQDKIIFMLHLIQKIQLWNSGIYVRAKLLHQENQEKTFHLITGIRYCSYVLNNNDGKYVNMKLYQNRG